MAGQIEQPENRPQVTEAEIQRVVRNSGVTRDVATQMVRAGAPIARPDMPSKINRR